MVVKACLIGLIGLDWFDGGMDGGVDGRMDRGVDREMDGGVD